LASEALKLKSQGDFNQATIGKNKNIATDIRSDLICWIDFQEHFEATKILKTKLDSLILNLNQKFFFGIKGFEGHYAIYPAGSFYKKHLDTFEKDGDRVLSFILYLNQNWKKTDGGELCLFEHNQNEFKDNKVIIEPLGGRLVLFLSHLVQHEVLKTNRERLSFTGWLKK
jgi:SM-20-related protein